jgi:TolB-like protein
MRLPHLLQRVFLTVTILFMLAVPVSAFADGPRVAVFPMKNNGQAQYNGLASGISAMITTNLNKSENLEVVEPQAVLGALSRARFEGGAPLTDDALKAAAKLDAAYAVTGTFLMFGGRFRVDVRVYDVGTGSLKFVDKAQASEQEFFDKVDELSDRIILKLAGSLPKAKGSLNIESTPAGASITLDGNDAGSTPASMVGIAPGNHAVELDLYGYKPFSQTVTVVEGETAEVKAVLVPLNGGIRVWWKDVPTSDVQVGSDIIPVSSFRFDENNPPRKYCRNLPAGTYRVSVRMPYKDESSWDTTRVWKTYSEEVEIKPGEVTDVYIYNKLFSPSLDVSTCGSCVANWDFDTDLIWFESVR